MIKFEFLTTSLIHYNGVKNTFLSKYVYKSVQDLTFFLRPARFWMFQGEIGASGACLSDVTNIDVN